MPTPINIALNKPTTASSYVKPYAPSKAVNGSSNALSRWEANFPSGSSAWMYVDLGAMPSYVKRYVVRHMSAAGFAPNYVINNFVFQGSNTANINDWVTLDTVMGNIVSVTDRAIPFVNFRYYRIATSTGLQCNPRLVNIQELEIYPATVLMGLTLSSGALTTAFSPAVISYTGNIGYDAASITVTPTAQYSSYVITVNGTTVISGQPSQAINLNVGNNPISIVVTNPASGDSTTYSLNAVRSSNPYLQNIAGPIVMSLSPKPVSPTVYSYTSKLGSAVTTTTITPTADDPNAIITISNNGANTQTVVSGAVSAPIPIVSGLNNIVIIVKSKTGTDQRTYTFAVTK